MYCGLLIPTVYRVHSILYLWRVILVEAFRHFSPEKKKEAFYSECITRINFQTFYFWRLEVLSSISKLENKLQGAYYKGQTNCALTQPLTPKRKLLCSDMEKRKAFIPSSLIIMIFPQIMLLLIMKCFACLLTSTRNPWLTVIQMVFPK